MYTAILETLGSPEYTFCSSMWVCTRTHFYSYIVNVYLSDIKISFKFCPNYSIEFISRKQRFFRRFYCHLQSVKVQQKPLQMNQNIFQYLPTPLSKATLRHTSWNNSLSMTFTLALISGRFSLSYLLPNQVKTKLGTLLDSLWEPLWGFLGIWESTGFHDNFTQ